MQKSLVVAMLICSFCLFVAVGLYFAQKDLETRKFTPDTAKNTFPEMGQGKPETPAAPPEEEFQEPSPEPQSEPEQEPTLSEDVPAEFDSVELVENNLPDSIEFWTQAYCPSGGLGFEYRVPAGYKVESCVYGDIGSHNGCSDCVMAKIRLVRDDVSLQSETTPAQCAAKKLAAPEIFNIDLSWSYMPADRIYAHIGYGYTDGCRAVYRLYRKIGTSGQWTLRDDTKTPTTAVSLADYDADKVGTDYYYYATAVVNGTESKPSAIEHIKIKIPECDDTDSDNSHITGVNYFVRGTVAEQTDYCANSDTLIEYFCSSSGGAANTQRQCANGCDLGACLDEAATSW